MENPGLFLFIFVFFNINFTQNSAGFSGIQTRIFIVKATMLTTWPPPWPDNIIVWYQIKMNGTFSKCPQKFVFYYI